jgi:hypothetical protein
VNTFSILVTILPFAALFINGALLTFARKKKQNGGEEISSESACAPQKKAGGEIVPTCQELRAWLRRHPWTLILLAILLILGIYLILFGPPRLTGEIPPTAAQPGRPFYGLRWLRTALSAHTAFFRNWSTLLVSLVSLGFLGGGLIKRSRPLVEASLLTAALAIAGLGQWAIGAGNLNQAVRFYGSAIIGFGLWGWAARDSVRLNPNRENAIPRRVESALLITLLALTAYGRLYAFPQVPYGIEGDETKWTSEAVNLMIDGRPDQSGEYHRDALPVSFYMQAPFHRILGPGIFAVRLEVILVSILATLVFYWLQRQIAPIPLAMLGTYFLAISIFDIAASRMGNVESHVKLWPILALALLAWAMRVRRWQIYALSGLALALGLMTYDTIWPLLPVMLILLLVEISKKSIPLKEKILDLSAWLAPTLFTLPLLIPYALSRWGYYNISNRGWTENLSTTLFNGLKEVLRAWFVASRSDFLFARPGPLINAFLLPWLVLGFVVAWIFIRQRYAGWNLTWLLLFLFPVPILAASPLGRVFYPALPAVYALVALGMYVTWQALVRALGSLRPLAVILAAAVLFWLPLLNYYIYFNEIAEANDRVVRRELGELVGQAAAPESLIILPIVPGANEPLNHEYQIIELYMHRSLSAEEIPSHYIFLPYDDFLPSLVTDFGAWERIEIIYDKVSPTRRSERDQVMAALRHCFPAGVLTSGTAFDRYTLDRAARENPACLPVRLRINPSGNDAMTWQLDQGQAEAVHLACERLPDQVAWIEAENYAQSTGWRPETAFVGDWNGTGFLMDAYGAQTATYTVELPASDQTFVWVRYLKRARDHSAAYLQLGDQSFPFANLENEIYNQWNWARLGPYRQTGEANLWTLSRPFEEEASAFVALFVDTLVFTTDPAYSPLSGLPGETMPEITIHYAAASQGTIPLPFPNGRYRCQASLDSALPLIDQRGGTPVLSEPILIEIEK